MLGMTIRRQRQEHLKAGLSQHDRMELREIDDFSARCHAAIERAQGNVLAEHVHGSAMDHRCKTPQRRAKHADY